MLHIKRKGVALLALAAIIAVAAGCGSSNKDKSTSSASSSAATSTAAAGNSAATATVQKLLVRPTAIGPTEPIKGGIPKGKKIVFIQCGFPDCAAIGVNAKKAAAAAGWDLTILPTQFTPESIKATWDEIVRRKPDGVITTGSFERSIYQSELDAAIKNGTQVVGIAEATSGEPWLVSVGAADGSVAGPAPSMQTSGSAYVASKLPDGGKVLVTNVPGVVIITQLLKVFKDQLAIDCPKCEYVSMDIPAASIGTTGATKIAAYLQAHPDIKYMYFTTPDLGVGLDAAEKAAGVTAVPFLTSNNNPPALDRLQKGEAGYQAATTYVGAVEGPWRAIDAIARHFTGQSVDADRDATAPQWIVEAGKVPTERPMPQVQDYETQFKQLWGVQ